jgi:hypothetical protein
MTVRFYARAAAKRVKRRKPLRNAPVDRERSLLPDHSWTKNELLTHIQQLNQELNDHKYPYSDIPNDGHRF